MSWFTKCYRRNLVDMHIEDWNPEFLSKFSPEAYLDNLVRAKIESAMIYVQSHVGYCNFPTKSGRIHNGFKGRENTIKNLMKMCREKGIYTVAYYSLIYNKWALDAHPEWAIHNGNGISSRASGNRHGLCCPNNHEYRQFTLEQIKEMAEYFEAPDNCIVDGMFYDMLFWPNICRCDSCQKRYIEEVGGEIPAAVDWNDPNWLTFQRKRQEWMGEFAMWVTNETKRYMPNVTVEHNYASGVAGDWSNAATELVNEACDYTGGDLYGDLFNHSFTCKYYMGVTKNPPFEYMTCRCDNNLTQHTATKSEDKLTAEIMLTAVHHGASFVIDGIDPVGTMDSRIYDRIGNVFAKQIPYEKYFNGDAIADVGVYYATTGRYNSEGYPFNSKTSSVAAVRTLVENHIPVCVLSNGNNSYEKLKSCRFIFAPSIAGLTSENQNKLINYVKEGGTLYFSGAEDKRLLLELAGAEYKGMTSETRTYVAPVSEYDRMFYEFNADFPMPFEYKLPIVEASEGVIATITLPYTNPSEQKYASIHLNPPGIPTDYPAMIIRKYGNGTVIWSAAPIEFDQRHHFKNVIMNILKEFVPEFTLETDASKKVEIVTFKTDNGYTIGAVDLNSDEEVIVRRPFRITLATDSKPSAVFKLPDSKNIEFIYSGGKVTFTTDELTAFDMYEVII